MFENMFDALNGVHAKLKELDKENNDLIELNQSLLKDNQDLMSRVKELEEENKQLKDIIRRYPSNVVS